MMNGMNLFALVCSMLLCAVLAEGPSLSVGQRLVANEVNYLLDNFDRKNSDCGKNFFNEDCFFGNPLDHTPTIRAENLTFGYTGKDNTQLELRVTAFVGISEEHTHVMSANEPKHYIQSMWVKDQNNDVIVGEIFCPYPCSGSFLKKSPTMEFSVSADTTSLTFYEHCNLHGAWEGPTFQVYEELGAVLVKDNKAKWPATNCEGGFDADCHPEELKDMVGSLVPSIGFGEEYVRVSVDHEMDKDHFISSMWIADDETGDIVHMEYLGDDDGLNYGNNPTVPMKVDIGKLPKKIRAFAHSNTDGTWQSEAMTIDKVVATFAPGISPLEGTITFFQGTSEAGDTTEVQVISALQTADNSNSNNHYVHIHVSPVTGNNGGLTCAEAGGHYDPTEKENQPYTCDPKNPSECYVGDLSGKHGLFDFKGNKNPKFFKDNTISLNGEDSIVGRSIVVHAKNRGSPRIACATIGHSVVADFGTGGAVEGKISFSQASPDSDAIVRVALLSGTEEATNDHKFHIHTHPPLDGNCDSAKGHFDPTGVEVAGYACDKTKFETCYVGDLSGKFGFLDLGTNAGAPAKQYVDGTISVADVVGRSIVVHAKDKGGPKIACAVIGNVVQASFAGSSALEGTLTFSQASPGSPTKLGYSVKNVDGQETKKHKFHVHVSPIDGLSCDSGGGHFDPFGVEIGGYTCDKAKPESCYAGDLSGKLGFLDLPSTDVEKLNAFVDVNGPNSIVGRSIVVHAKDAGGPKIACATIGTSVSAAFSTPGSPITGSVVFAQAYEGSPTVVRLNLKREDDKTSNRHFFHVHVNPIDGVSCASAGGHFDPFGVEIGGYTCDKSKPESCYVGDLSGKHGLVNFPTGNVEYTDKSLQLSGENSLLGRSLVIHAANEGSPRIACASIGNVVTAEFNRPGSAVKGSIVFAQAVPGAPTTMRVALSHASEDSPSTVKHKYHIHEYPADGATCASAGGHYDPAGVEIGGYTCDKAKPEACYSGDLSGKLGLLDIPQSQNVYSNLVGVEVLSIIGRSIVIHAADEGSPRFACATIGNVVTASFNSGLEGKITFSQSVAGSPTIVRYHDLKREDGQSTKDHKIHVHVNPVEGDSCASAGGHYDPEGVETADYKCGVSPTPYFGDMSCKYGFLSVPSGKTEYVDKQLDVTGPNSVAGRSIVVHAKDKGGPRIACATIGYAATARFDVPGSPVEGTVTFIQAAPGQPTRLVYDLKRTDGRQSSGHKIHVHSHYISGTSCDSSLGHWDPFGVEVGNYNCVKANPETCYSGDISGKKTLLSFPNTNTLENLGLEITGPNSILGRSVVIHAANNGAPKYACATIGKVVAAAFPPGGKVEGELSFAQQAIGEPTLVRMNLRQGPGSNASTGHYIHIHEEIIGNGDCKTASGHFDPKGVEVNGYTCDAAKPETCYVGDLSGKRSLLDLPSGNVEYLDPTIKLSGPEAINFRSVVVHAADKGSPRIACGSLFDPIPRVTLQGFEAVARFASGAVIGEIYFKQHPEGLVNYSPYLKNADGSSTKNHKYHIHTSMVYDNDCSTAGGHYDPMGVEVEGYTCDKTKPKDCYVGDLSGKHGGLSIPSNFFQNDVGLDMYGLRTDNKVGLIGKSIVIHAKDGGKDRYACTTITPYQSPETSSPTPVPGTPTASPTPRKRAIIASFAEESALKGTVLFEQSAPGGAVTVTLDVSYKDASMAPTEGHKFHVHVDPITNFADCKTGGGHWDPFGVEIPGNYNPSKDNMKTYYAGDISGRHGAVSIPSTMTYVDEGSSLDLFEDDANTLAGRSVVFHAANGGAPRLACATIGYQAVVELNSTEVSGTVSFTQASPDYPTVVNVDLVNKDGSTTSGHKYHVHASSVSADDVDCASAGGHFDPTGVETDLYSCDKSAPDTCYAGDLSGRFGPTNIPSTKARYVDIGGLYVWGEASTSIIDRSVVVHDANGAGRKIACGTINKIVDMTNPENIVEPEDKGLGTGVIVGIVIGSLVGLAGLAGLFIFCRSNKSSESRVPKGGEWAYKSKKGFEMTGQNDHGTDIERGRKLSTFVDHEAGPKPPARPVIPPKPTANRHPPPVPKKKQMPPPIPKKRPAQHGGFPTRPDTLGRM